MTRKLRILVVCPALLRPDTSAGDRRLFEILTLLAKRHTVDLYCLVDAGERTGDKTADDERYLSMYRGIGVHYLSGHAMSIHRVLLRRVYDVGLFEYWYVAAWTVEVLRGYQPWARAIIDTVDVNFLRAEAGLKLGFSNPDEVEADRLREIASYRRADALMVITPEDRDALDACGEMPRQFLVPIITRGRPRPDQDRVEEALFVGGFDHRPNVDGIVWFVKEIWPAIRSGSGRATLTVVGSNPPPPVRDLGRVEGVSVVGYVPSTEPYLDRAAVSVSPLRFGAGMKGKVVEAMASGLAVVTTSVGAQGLEAVSGSHLLVADEPGEFAQQVLGCLRDPARAERIGREGRELVASFSSPEVVDARLEEMLAEILTPGRPVAARVRWLIHSAVDRMRHRLRQSGEKVIPPLRALARRLKGHRSDSLPARASDGRDRPSS